MHVDVRACTSGRAWMRKSACEVDKAAREGQGSRLVDGQRELAALDLEGEGKPIGKAT